MTVPKFYFSLRSPYSWLAYHDMVTRHQDLIPRLRWIPYWEPDEVSSTMLTDAGGRFDYATMPKAKHLYVLRDVRRLAARRGMRPNWPVDREPHWEVPHLAYFAAEQHGLGHEFITAAYRMRWQEGADICDRATMADLATELGLPAELLSSACDEAEPRRLGVQALLDAYNDGVFGVPFMVNRFEKFWGTDRLDDFLVLIQDRERRSRDSGDAIVDTHVALAGEGHAGGCG
jgi:2-hydroxychromene-2-carboxylate isomerase